MSEVDFIDGDVDVDFLDDAAMARLEDDLGWGVIVVVELVDNDFDLAVF